MEQYEEHYGIPLQLESKDKLVRVLRLSDHAQIPISHDNVDYVDYLEWKEKGGVPTIVNDYTEPSTDDKRKSEYEKAGCTIDAMIVALWEKVVEDRPESAEALQKLREDVKISVPKVIKGS